MKLVELKDVRVGKPSFINPTYIRSVWFNSDRKAVNVTMHDDSFFEVQGTLGAVVTAINEAMNAVPR